MKKLCKMWRSKTMRFALLLVIFGVIELNLPLFQNVIPPEYWGLVVTLIGVIVAVLRFVTTTSLDEK